MIPDSLLELAAATLDESRRRGQTIATAESCTGGLVAACLTAIAGSSDVVERGFVTYTNESKMELLGVQRSSLVEHGAVSEPVARAMAEGALAASSATLAVSVTGIAGPGGATENKPVGLVHMSCARRDMVTLHRSKVFSGDRNAVRAQTVREVLLMILERLEADI